MKIHLFLVGILAFGSVYSISSGQANPFSQPENTQPRGRETQVREPSQAEQRRIEWENAHPQFRHPTYDSSIPAPGTNTELPETRGSTIKQPQQYPEIRGSLDQEFPRDFGVNDLMVLSLRDVLNRDRELSRFADVVDVINCNGNMILFGVVDNENAKNAIELRLRGMVTGRIENRIIVKTTNY